MTRWLVRGLGAGLAAVVGLLVLLRLLYGGGDAFPPVGGTAVAKATTFLTADWPLANVVASPDGRVFFNYHVFGHPHRFGPTVFEVVDGKAVPYPDAAFQERYQGTFGMTVDRRGRLWFVETGGLDHPATRLLAFDLATDTLVYDYTFPSGVARFAQDLRMGPDGHTLVLADTGMFHIIGGSLIVFDTEAREVVRTFSGHPSLDPQHWSIRRYDGAPHTVGYGLLTFAVGVDGIALDPSGTWLYYASMSHDTLYRIRWDELVDASLDDRALGERALAMSRKPLSDGIEVAPDGRIVVTDIEHGGLVVIHPTLRTPQTWTRDASVVWSDGVTITADGYALYTDSAIPAYLGPLLQPPSRAVLEANRPYRILRVAL